MSSGHAKVLKSDLKPGDQLSASVMTQPLTLLPKMPSQQTNFKLDEQHLLGESCALEINVQSQFRRSKSRNSLVVVKNLV